MCYCLYWIIPVSLGVDVLHGNLKSIKATSLRDLNFLHEPCGKILIDNSITSSKERKDVGDEVLLVIIEFLFPVHQVRLKVNLLSGPETGFCLLVHFPYFMVLDGEEHKALIVGCEEELLGRHGVVDVERQIARIPIPPFYPRGKRAHYCFVSNSTSRHKFKK